MRSKRRHKRTIFFIIFFLLLALASTMYAFYGLGWLGQLVDLGKALVGLSEAATSPVPNGLPTVTALPEFSPGLVDPQDTENGLPYDKLFITVERQNYQSGDLQLLIPKLDINASVWAGTTTEDLAHGACLYEYAQLPGQGNRNVSIAAHRNGRRNGIVNDDGLFYYIDQLEKGDYLYLTDDQKVYRYLYESTSVVEADDWWPIYSQGFSCLTLTSCEPIGISTHRIIVRGKLEEIIPLTEDYNFLAGI